MQIYVTHPPEVGEPPKQVRDFQRVDLSPGESGTVRMRLDERDFDLWNTATGDWTVAAGTYRILFGTSSVDTQSQANLIIE